MKWPWLFTGSIAALAIALGLLLNSQRAVLALAHWSMQQFTDFRLELVEPELDLLGGRLAAAQFHLLPAVGGAPLVSLYNVTAITRLTDILAADLLYSRLRAEHLVLYVSEDETADTGDGGMNPREFLQLSGWLPREFRLDAAHLVFSAGGTRIIQLASVRGERTSATSFELTTRGLYQGDPLDATLQLLALRDAVSSLGAELKLSMRAPDSDSILELDGTLRGSETDFHYDFEIQSFSADFAAFLQGLLPLPELGGELTLKGRMRGDSNGFRLTDIAATLDNMPAYGFEAAGSMAYQVNDKSEIELTAAGELTSVEWLLRRMDLDLGDFGRAQANLSLSGSLDQPIVDDFVLRTRNHSGLDITLGGRLDTPLERSRSGGDRNEIQIDAMGPGPEVLQPWLGVLPSAIGAWRASGMLLERGEKIALQDLVVELGQHGSLEVRAEGSIGDIAGVAERGLAGVEDIDLELTAFTPDSAELASLLELDLLRYHRAEASLKLAGNGARLRGFDGNLMLQSSDLLVGVAPVSFDLMPLEEEPLLAMAATVELQLSDTGALSQYSGVEVPVLGPLAIRGELLKPGSGASLALRDIEALVSGEEMQVRARGSIADLPRLQGVSLDTRFRGLDIRELLAILLEGFQYDAGLGELRGGFVVTDSRRRWNLDGLQLRAGYDSGPLEIDLKGGLKDLGGMPSANLRGTFHVRDPGLAQALTGMAMSPAQGSVSVTSVGERIKLSSNARVGESILRADGTLGFVDSGIGGLTLALEVPRLQLEDLGLRAETGNEAETASKAGAGDGDVLSVDSILSALPTYPLDVRINADRIVGDNTDIRDLAMHVTGGRGRYTLRRLSAGYDGARAEFSAVAELGSGPPILSVGGEAMTLPMSAIGGDLGIETDFKGVVSLRGGLTAEGEDTEALLSSLQGNLAVALENAVVEGAAYDVLASDLLGWLYSGAALEESTVIDCAMVDLALSSGVARSDSLYVETDRMLATGTLELDLNGQAMDLTLTPLSKSRALQVPSTVRVKGPFSDLQPEISPISAVLDTYSAWITLVPQLALEVFGFKGSAANKKRPCQA